MKSRKDFKKKNANYRRNQEEGIRIKAIKKQPKKISKLTSLVHKQKPKAQQSLHHFLSQI